MDKINFATLQTVKAGDIISDENKFGLVYSVIKEDGRPVSLEILPITAGHRKSQKPEDKALEMMPAKLAHQARLPDASSKNYWVSQSLTQYTPNESFVVYTAIGRTNFVRELLRDIDDQKIAALNSAEQIIAEKPDYTKPPTYTSVAKKPTGARLLDISLDDLAGLKLCAADAAFITILKNAKFSRLKTAFKLASSPADADRLHQIYEATQDAPISFEQFRKDIKATWTKLSGLIDKKDPHINHDHLWFTSDEKIGFKFTEREANISIADARTTNYIKSKYLPYILETMGFSSLGDAFISANEAPKAFKKAFKKAAPDMNNPEPVMKDIIHEWEAFQLAVISNPYELMAKVKIFYPKCDMA